MTDKRIIAEVRKLNPRLQDFATWLADNRDKFRG
jgi:hypothetical protein